MTDYTAELDVATRAVRRAGAAVMRYFGRDLVVTHKSPGQPLTEADLEANRMLLADLLGAFPDYGWLSEETVDSPDRLGRERVWIVDPIDGTRSFIAGRPEFTLSVGLADAGHAVVGVVYNPARDELFHACRGTGAWLERGGAAAVRLTAGTRALGDDISLLASRSEIAAGEFDPFRDSWRIEPAGSTAYKLACIAAAHGDAFVSRGPKSEWDICAGVLIVAEAGGCATDLNGVAPLFNGPDPYVHGIIAASRALHEALLRRIGELPVPQRLARRERDPMHPGLERGET